MLSGSLLGGHRTETAPISRPGCLLATPIWAGGESAPPAIAVWSDSPCRGPPGCGRPIRPPALVALAQWWHPRRARLPSADRARSWRRIVAVRSTGERGGHRPGSCRRAAGAPGQARPQAPAGSAGLHGLRLGGAGVRGSRPHFRAGAVSGPAASAVKAVPRPAGSGAKWGPQDQGQRHRVPVSARHRLPVSGGRRRD